MNIIEWFVFFLLLQVIHFAGTWRLYTKAGRKAWEAAVPVYNAIVLMQIINRPKWWTILLFIPIVNLIMFPVIWVETIRSFGKNSLIDTLLVLFTFGFYTYYLNYTQDLKHLEGRSLVAATKMGDTVSSLLFAIVVATIVHTYFVQPFTIPTSSLERTLLVGDFLFVSKMNYGARTPMTTIAAPMVHDTIPVAKTKSYLKWPQLPYFRFPGFEKIKKNDIVVFNWPADTVPYFRAKKGLVKGVYKPVDKRSNYVKRCVGIPGDKLEVKNGVVFVNDREFILSDRAKVEYAHKVYSKSVITEDYLKTVTNDYYRAYKVQISTKEQEALLMHYIQDYTSDTIFTEPKGLPAGIMQRAGISYQELYLTWNGMVNLTLKEAEEMRKNPAIDSVVRYIAPKETDPKRTTVFPHDLKWTQDNYGPITIPKQGVTVQLTKENLPLYQRIIQVYEKNDFALREDQILINNKPATSYTFKMNYYWMMGDNRHKSEDSRYWGFVPEDHIVGKPVFIWMSIDGINDGIKNWSIRWDRLFTTVGGSGEPYSYFKFFLIALAAYFGITFFMNRKKAKTA
jgi:signal peptidase I